MIPLPRHLCLLFANPLGVQTNTHASTLFVHDRLIPVIAAIASSIALAENPRLKSTIPDAVELAVRYVEAGIMTGFKLGGGHGPINHFHSLAMKLSPPCPSTLTRTVFR